MSSTNLNIRRFLIGAMLVVVMATAVAACLPSPAKVVSQITDAMRTAYLEMDKYYNGAVRQETELSRAYQQWQEGYSTMLVGAGESNQQVQACYKSGEEFVAQAANGVFGKDASGNPLSAAAEKQAFINALSVGGSLYAGDMTQCQQMASTLMDYLRVNRGQIQGLRDKFNDELRVYNNTLNDSMEAAAFNRLWMQFGPELAKLAQQGEADIINAIASQNQLTPLPLDFIGFPTSALKARTKSQALCNQYLAIFNGQAPAPMGRNPALYQAEWDPAGYCTLSRMSALGYMNNLFVSAQAANRLDCGQDASAFDSVNKDCSVQSGSVIPTPLSTTQTPAS